MLEKPKKLPLKRLKREQEEKVTKRRAKEEGYSYVNLISTPIDHEAVTLLGEEEARQARAATVQKIGKRLEIVIFSSQLEPTKELIEKLKNQGYNLDIFIVSQSSLNKAWHVYETYIKPRQSLKGVFQIKEELFKDLEKGFKNIENFKEKILTLSTSEILGFIIAGAYFSNASDIHLEPTETFTRLRYRIDGVLHDIIELKKIDYSNILSRVKILSGLKINIHDINQDGRFTISLTGEKKEKRKVDVRVSVLPGSHGETIVMRLLGTAVAKLPIEKLGIRDKTFALVKEALRQPNGLILTTGPTGSGKTTTLYSFLNHIKNPEINIITAEDPIEYQLAGITQSQINPKEGYTFAQSLKAIVRQDPDVILVGEIRDRETADTAIQASLTGHLVFSTLHTNNAAGTIPRLRDLGADEKAVTTGLKLVMAQRLVRVLCPHCKEAYEPSSKERQKIEKELSDLKDREKYPPLEKLYRPKGCDKCRGLGYQGRVGIFEVFNINPELERLILSRATHTDILELLKKQGFMTMRQDGLLKAIEGKTSLEEVNRVT